MRSGHTDFSTTFTGGATHVVAETCKEAQSNVCVTLLRPENSVDSHKKTKRKKSRWCSKRK